LPEAPADKPAKFGGLLKSKLLMYIGAFFLSYIIICAIMFFLFKGKYDTLRKQQASADSLALAQMDTSRIDTAALAADTTAHPADTSAVTDTLALASADTIQPPVAAPAETTAAIPETTLAALPDTLEDTAITALLGAKPAPADTAAVAAYQKRIAKLVKIVDKMKPIDTASIFSKLDDELVLQLLIRMNDRNAAKVLSQLPPSRAARLTAKLGSQTSG